MATQGLVSFVDKDYNVLAKVVVGCNGHIADRFIDHVDNLDEDHLKSVAESMKLGCNDCRVIQVRPGKLGTLYYSKFDDPGFNPRWSYGTADYVRIVIWE